MILVLVLLTCVFLVMFAMKCFRFSDRGVYGGLPFSVVLAIGVVGCARLVNFGFLTLSIVVMIGLFICAFIPMPMWLREISAKTNNPLVARQILASSRFYYYRKGRIRPAGEPYK